MPARRSRFVVFAVVSLFAACCATIVSAPQSVFPDIALARVEVFADAGELTSASVRDRVAVPLEAELATVPGLRATRTYADPGKLELELDFAPATDPQVDLRAVRAVVDTVRERLPVTNVTALIEGPEAEPVVTYAITSASMRQAELARRTEAALVSTFVGTPQLGRLTVFGGPRVAYEIDLDSARLETRHMSARDVSQAILSASEPHVAGDLVRGRERFPIVSGATVRDAASLRAVEVRARDGTIARVSDLGRVSERDEETGQQASFDGTHAVLLNAYPVANGDAVDLARNVAERLPKLRAGLPPDATITPAWDQTRLITASQRALLVEMCIGALVALAAIAFFLRDRALILVAAIVLPIAIVFTLAAIVRVGLRLDLMTLGGIAVAIGLIVDEAIVVIESIARALEERVAGTHRAAIAEAVGRIAKPLVASTAANAVVFAPLAFLSGIPGFFFRALAITLALALVISIVLSLFVAPWLAAGLGARARRTASSQFIERGYLSTLRWMSRHTIVVYSGAIAAVAVAALLLVRTPTDFLPQVDEGQFEIRYALPPGTSLAEADTLSTTMERTILLDNRVDHVARLSGVDTNGYLATPPDAGTLRVTLKPAAQRDPFDTIADHLRDEVRNVDPYAAVEVHQLLEDQINDLSGAPEPIQLTVAGPDQERLTKIAAKLADDIVDIKGIDDAFDGVTFEARSRRALPNGSDDAQPAAFADDVRARVGGIDAGVVADPGGAIPVVVKIADSGALEKQVRLGPPALTSTIQEENGNRIVRVTAEIENADLSTVTAAIEQRIERDVRALPSGYTVTLGGAIAEQRQAFTEFATILGIALVLVFGVLVATFDSFRLPLVVLAAVPLTPIGVALALVITKTPLNVASFMGMLLLVGIVVRNGILLVESANRRVREGASPTEAMEGAASERLRPILMTTVATLGALAPLAFGIGAGSELERPLAIAVIGGIVTATGLTLAIVPVLYVATSRATSRATAQASA